jgi:hypothetical protein
MGGDYYTLPFSIIIIIDDYSSILLDGTGQARLWGKLGL